jgi:hypothetical protein
MPTISEIQATLSAIRASVARQGNSATWKQAGAIANCESALANMAAYEAKRATQATKRSFEITFIDRERLKIVAGKASTEAARVAARRLLDRDPPRMTEAEKRRFKL